MDKWSRNYDVEQAIAISTKTGEDASKVLNDFYAFMAEAEAMWDEDDEDSED